MRNHRTTRGALGSLALIAGLGFAGAASASPGFAGGPPQGSKGSDKKARNEWTQAEGQQGQGQAPGQGGATKSGFENPLVKILKLMDRVENHLYDADTGQFTQKEQRKIIEAMRFEGKTSTALENLIKQVEQQQQQQSQSSGQQQREQKRRKETPKERKERQRRERERMKREKEREAQRRIQNFKQNRKKPKNDRARREAQRRRQVKPPRDSSGALKKGSSASGRWGMLPEKLHQDAKNAENQPMPTRWEDLIKKYRIRLSATKDDGK